MSGLEERLRQLAATPVLLAACDFDGTLSAFAGRPHEAAPDARAWRALMELSELPHTHAAVISGRSLSDLAERIGGDLGRLELAGSHGLETADDSIRLGPDDVQRLARLVAMLQAEAERLPGAIVEVKPASATFHYRLADPGSAADVVGRVVARAELESRALVMRGHKVIELFVVEPSKGSSLRRLRFRVGATAAVFIGDDSTDEAAFLSQSLPDLGIKVGEGATTAPARVSEQSEVAAALEQLLAARRDWLSHRRVTPIEHHSILSDQRTIAVVDPLGSIVWACLPRIDSPPIFAALVGDEKSGSFTIAPMAGPGGMATPRQSYDRDSFVLVTEWDALRVVDYLDCTGGRAYQRAGRSELVRVIEPKVEGARAVVRFAPRLDFGRSVTRLTVRAEEGGGLEVDGWMDPIVLRSPGVSWRVSEQGGDDIAEAEIDLRGGPVVLELRFGTAALGAPVLSEVQRREQTRRFWSGWASSLKLPTLVPESVKRSALTIKALCHGPTGAIAAAGTTSLPEHLGGVRNWDYRFCWVRDACMAASALARIGNTGVGLKLLDWLVGVVEKTDSPERLRPLYTVSGSMLGPEAEIAEMAGYGGSRPVRIGNAAAHQVQLDVFGPIVELVALMTEQGAPVTPEQWRLVEAMVRAVELRWREPDHGIWEIRGPKRHHVHTKAMCWMAVDRGLLVADRAMGMRRPAWRALREEIAADVHANGWSEQARAFSAAYGETVLDAASLFVGLSGMVPAQSERFVATVEAVDKHLREGPVVYRYRSEDGLPGREGGWLICATWLAESLAMIGRMEEARAMLDRVIALAGPTGLMAEEFDPQYGIALGNFPQTYSHLGVINAAVRLAAAR